MRYPEFLQKNGRIGFIAPSFGAVIEPYRSLFLNGKNRFNQLGYETVLGPNCFEDKGIGKSNTPKKCGEEINDFFINDRSDVIISCGGGETMCEDLPYVDFEGISKAKPKWYMGYSDNTNLTILLPTLCDTAAIYGPCAGAFGMEPWHEAIRDAFSLLCGEKLKMSNYPLWEKESKHEEDFLATYNVTEPYAMRLYGGIDGKARFTGRLLGGCMDCLTTLCGTKFDRVKEFTESYAEDGIVWFLESCELNPMSVRRVLWQLDNAGWFNNAKGFIIGRPGCIDADGMGFDRFTAVEGILGKYNVPIVFDADIGHLPPMIPVISGALAEIYAYENSLNIEYMLK